MLTILEIYVTINITVCVTINSMLLFIALVYSTNFGLIWSSDIFCYWCTWRWISDTGVCRPYPLVIGQGKGGKKEG